MRADRHIHQSPSGRFGAVEGVQSNDEVRREGCPKGDGERKLITGRDTERVSDSKVVLGISTAGHFVKRTPPAAAPH